MERYRVEEVRTPQFTWVVDELRRCFRRVPADVDPSDPMTATGWVPYHCAWRDPRTGALTLSLDRAGTHLLRVGP